MSFDAAEFLTELFGVVRDETPGDQHEADGAGIGDAPDFSGWVLRPDRAGRMGWEAPSLPDAVAWWREANFEDLPEPDDLGELAVKARRLRATGRLPSKPVSPRPGQCPRCRSSAVRDVTIHSGQSVRRSCARCGRHIRFVRWYGRNLGAGGVDDPATKV